MTIDKELFDECFCPCCGIGRVCLNGSKGIPKELENIAKNIDGENYMESCFCIDVFKGGALIYYIGENEFKELFVCDNNKDVLEYYKKNASEKDLEETFSEWDN